MMLHCFALHLLLHTVSGGRSDVTVMTWRDESLHFVISIIREQLSTLMFQRRSLKSHVMQDCLKLSPPKVCLLQVMYSSLVRWQMSEQRAARQKWTALDFVNVTLNGSKYLSTPIFWPQWWLQGHAAAQLKFAWKSLKTELSVVFSQERQLPAAEMSSKLVQSIFKRINLPVGERGGH